MKKNNEYLIYIRYYLQNTNFEKDLYEFKYDEENYIILRIYLFF